MKYAIIGKTDGYKANRNYLFNGATKLIVKVFDTLKEANKELLSDFNEDWKTNCKNWGNAVATGNVSKTFKDGTRSYEYDGYHWSTQGIEEIKDEEGNFLENWEYEKMNYYWDYELRLINERR